MNSTGGCLSVISGQLFSRAQLISGKPVFSMFLGYHFATIPILTFNCVTFLSSVMLVAFHGLVYVKGVKTFWSFGGGFKNH